MKISSSLVVLGGCVAAFIAALWHAPAAFRQLDTEAAAYAHATPLERSLSAAYGERIDPRFLVRARSLIPPTATYAVITGGAAAGADPGALTAITPFAGYWLLPRRQVQFNASPAPEWILSYGGDLQSLGYHYPRVVRIASGLEIAKVTP